VYVWVVQPSAQTSLGAVTAKAKTIRAMRRVFIDISYGLRIGANI